MKYLLIPIKVTIFQENANYCILIRTNQACLEILAVLMFHCMQLGEILQETQSYYNEYLALADI